MSTPADYALMIPEIKPERLPDQVIARFDHAFLEERQSGWTLDMAYRHAFAAGLAAWPNAELDEAMWKDGPNFLILPLTQESGE